MNPANPTVLAAAAAFVTAGAVSWATPDGNLVVTLVPALLVGLLVYGAAAWRRRRAQALTPPSGSATPPPPRTPR